MGTLGRILCLLALLALAACGQTEAKDGRIRISYWEKWTNFEKEAMGDIVDRYNKSQDKVFVEYLSISQIDRKLLLATAGGNPNTGGAGSVLDTQRERGEKYAQFTADYLAYPMMIGMHWFQFSDQSPQGRFDGENSNYGVVDIYHRQYPDLLSQMAAANATLHDVHAKSDRRAPSELPKPGAKATFIPGQFPNRPPRVELLGVESVMPPASFGASDATIALAAAGKALEVKLSTGDSWGAGISFFGPKASAVAGATSPAADLDGYELLELDAEMPKGTEFRFVLDEAGADAPGGGKYDTSGGDDSESFALPPAAADGGRQTFKFHLADLESRYEWGNQAGKRRVDMNSLKGPAIIFASGFEGTVTIHSLRFER